MVGRWAAWALLRGGERKSLSALCAVAYPSWSPFFVFSLTEDFASALAKAVISPPRVPVASQPYASRCRHSSVRDESRGCRRHATAPPTPPPRSPLVRTCPPSPHLFLLAPPSHTPSTCPTALTPPSLPRIAAAFPLQTPQTTNTGAQRHPVGVSPRPVAAARWAPSPPRPPRRAPTTPPLPPPLRRHPDRLAAAAPPAPPPPRPAPHGGRPRRPRRAPAAAAPARSASARPGRRR